MPRKLKNWLDSYLEYTKDTEPDEKFKIGVALWAVSGALQRKSWVKLGDYDFYSNLYMVLAGPAGEARKSTAIRPALQLLETLNAGCGDDAPNVMLSSHKTTPEALVKWAAATILSAPHNEAGWDIHHNSVSLAASELATFIGRENGALVDLLNDWFDCPAPWTNRTIIRGSETVEAVWFNMIGGATPSYLAQLFTPQILETGLGSRIIFVYSEEKARDIAIPRLGGEGSLSQAMKADLYHIFQTYTGPVLLSPAAERWYETWYYDKPRWRTLVEAKLKPYEARKPYHIVKFAHIYHACWSDTMILEPEDFAWAERFMRLIEPQMGKALKEISNSPEAILVDKLLATIQSQKNGTINPVHLFAMHQADASPMELNRLITALVDMKKLKYVTFPSTGSVRFIKYIQPTEKGDQEAPFDAVFRN